MSDGVGQPKGNLERQSLYRLTRPGPLFELCESNKLIIMRGVQTRQSVLV